MSYYKPATNKFLEKIIKLKVDQQRRDGVVLQKAPSFLDKCALYNQSLRARESLHSAIFSQHAECHKHDRVASFIDRNQSLLEPHAFRT